ncbi:MAG: Beta-phosphoglucomutase [Thermodesulfobacterium sp.]|uniref:Beta-phosphoglucomutase n=1 Tax=Candidatus Thermodesulfobacterium syntrophicum TaxID=3060442 RepID=A0AAE3TG15_9BACT|nr:Beta-phosphoglucomutase [Candidatus Thermodesulfobacterium syntrophicum]
MKDYLFFDLDGVILDSMPYHAKAWIEAFSQFGLKFEEKEIYLHEGAIELDTARDMFLKKGVKPTPDFFEKIFKIQKSIFKSKYAKLVKPFPEVPDLLKNLKKEKKKIALVTSSHSEIFNEVFPKELLPYFSLIITGDKIEKRKPNPDPYLRALETFKIKNKEALVVENSPAGVMSAKNAKLFCIGITTTLSEQHLSLADLIVKNHKELQEILLNGKKEQ